MEQCLHIPKASGLIAVGFPYTRVQQCEHTGLCFASVEENKHSQWLLGKKNQIKRKKNLSLLLLMFSLKRNSLIGWKAVEAAVYFFFVSFFVVGVCFD